MGEQPLTVQLSAGVALGQTACPVSMPDPLDLVRKRFEMVTAYPTMPDPITAAGLRQQGSKHSIYETSVIGGWRSEIEGRCDSVKVAETKVARLKKRGELSPNEAEACKEAIEDERQLCDIKNKATSPFYHLLGEIEKFNIDKYSELTAAWNECTRNNTCNP
jgi:hypothetical protein